MQLLIKNISCLIKEWNSRALSDVDFYDLCRRFRITVTEMPLTTGGFYYRLKGRDFIAIDSRLSGTKRLFVMFHELGHFLLHVPDSGVTANFHGVGRRTRKEREADLFAACALIPRSLVMTRSPDELVDDGFDAELVRQRYSIFLRKQF